MKKFILFSILSVLFYSAPGHTMFRREGETQKRGWYYAPYLESSLLSQAAAARRHEEKEKAEKEAARERKAEAVRLHEEQAAAAGERRLAEARRQAAEIVQDAETAEKVTVIISRAMEKTRKIKNEESHVRKGLERAEKAETAEIATERIRKIASHHARRDLRLVEKAKKAAEKEGAEKEEIEKRITAVEVYTKKQLELGNLLTVVEQEKAQSMKHLLESGILEQEVARRMQHLREFGTLWEEKGVGQMLAEQRRLASSRAAAEEPQDDAPVPTSSRAHGAGTKEPEAAE